MPSELRKDPLSQRWVIIAADRAKRPGDFEIDEAPAKPEFDPFLPGNEDKTPPEIAAYRKHGTAPNQPGWRVRVIPNRFPALQIEGALNKKGEGIYDRMQGVGAHEVIIDAPQCVRSISELSDAQVQEMLWMYRDRLVDLSRDKRLKYGMIYKNVGEAAGASLYHTHSQLIVTPIIPRTLTQKLEACEEFYDYRGRCLICDMVAQEAETKSRVVTDTGLFLSFQPYAPRTPFETWIVPKNHESRYEDIGPQGCEELGALLRRTIERLEKGLGPVAYNYMFFTSPFDAHGQPHFHWHIEIIPRITRLAGFEWGTGFYINPVPPEDAAEFLRGIKL
ncbi:MAG TPA: galactose-1-phosphate uridylyltransferase [Planctomycetota bacterium]|nr:galactose-1-phosphate uridylyltransferase [Planctomycetota bacterium]